MFLFNFEFANSAILFFPNKFNPKDDRQPNITKIESINATFPNSSGPKTLVKCGIKSSSKTRTRKFEDLIKKFNLIHNNKYDYSKSKYLSSKEKIKIICPEHGEFEQTPSKHQGGQKCPDCSLMGESQLE